MRIAGHRLLILDDEPEVGRIIGLIAEGAGFEWRSTTHPEQFFHELDIWEPTHLAIDLVMPEMDGVQVMRQLSQRGCACRIVITSGVGSRVMDAAMRSGVEHGLDVRGVVPKPFSALTLRVLLLDEPDDWPVSAAKKQEPQQFEPLASASPLDFEEAIKYQHFTMLYQPKIDCTSGALTGFEALVRLNADSERAQTPSSFVDRLDDNELAGDFCRQTFEQSVQWFGSAFADSDITLAISISARHLMNPQFIDGLLERCEAQSLAPERIIVELSEATAMQGSTRLLATLTRLRMKGVALSLNDFGTGYSSMVQLVRLPFSEIKVDSSFVTAINQSHESLAIVKSIIDLGHSLKLKVTAEGAEDAATAQLLKSLGCDLLQGPYVSVPMSGTEVMQWLAKRH